MNTRCSDQDRIRITKRGIRADASPVGGCCPKTYLPRLALMRREKPGGWRAHGRAILIALLLFLLTACAAPGLTTGRAPSHRLIIFAAASLTESFGELGRQFEAENPGVQVIFNFAGSQQLRAQLAHGASADVFASANTREMDAAVAAGLVVTSTQQTFARNRLIVIFPGDNSGQIRSLADLARPGLKLEVADPSVPAGQYTLDMLDKMSRDPAFGPAYRDRVLANVVSREESVKAVVSKVQLGEVDAGVAYATDVTGDVRERTGSLAIPDRFNQVATYPIAPMSGSRQPELARRFVDLVLSSAGQQVLASYGFITLDRQ